MIPKNQFVHNFKNFILIFKRKLKNSGLYLPIIIVSVVILFLISILFFPLFISLNEVEIYSKIILNIALSFGAFFGGLGGLKLISDFLNQKKIETKIKELQELYPFSKLGDSFDLVKSEKTGNMIFIRNKTTNNLHHIGNRWTLRDLGFYGSKTIKLNNDKLETYTRGITYLTRGEIGE